MMRGTLHVFEYWTHSSYTLLEFVWCLHLSEPQRPVYAVIKPPDGRRYRNWSGAYRAGLKMAKRLGVDLVAKPERR